MVGAVVAERLEPALLGVLALNHLDWATVVATLSLELVLLLKLLGVVEELEDTEKLAVERSRMWAAVTAVMVSIYQNGPQLLQQGFPVSTLEAAAVVTVAQILAWEPTAAETAEQTPQMAQMGQRTLEAEAEALEELQAQQEDLVVLV